MQNTCSPLARSVRNQNPYLLPIITGATVVGILLCAGGMGVVAYLLAMASNP